MANALIGIQHDDNTVTAIECYESGELSGAGSTLYSCYAVRDKVEALVRFGSVRQLERSLANTGFIPGAISSRQHKPQRFGNRNEYARAGAARSPNVYVMQKNGDWRMLEGVGTKGNPRWPGLKRVIGENGLRAPVVTRHDDHDDPDVIASIEALVGATSAAVTAPASRPSPAPSAAPASALSGTSGSGGVVLEPLVIEMI